MKSISLITSFWFVVAAFFIALPSSADEITFFGDFEDKFGAVPVTYESDVPYDPGVLIPLASELVVGIPKFDPSLGTLTDIEIFVEPSSAILYSLGGGMEVFEVDDSLPDYFASIELFGEVSLNYVSGTEFLPVLSEVIPLIGSGTGDKGTGSFSTPVTTPADGSLTGSLSVLGSVDLADFVGPGVVDKLFVEMFIEDTADFMVDNATASAGLAFDVFDSDSGADDAVIGVTYTFTPVPEPSTLLGIGGLAVCCWTRRRRNAT